MEKDDKKEQLKQTLDEAEWSWVKPHALRDSVIIVEASLSILDVAVAVAHNQVAQMKSWIDQGHVRKPTAAEISEWDLYPSQKFQSIIVQPFVLIQIPKVLH
ncbi:DUF2288 domain-containing protein [bacterium]|jgi:hypothetical protein|nr:DUF2288 domain-containing protein [bacterium]